MRRRHDGDEDALEALAVYDEHGAVVEPEPVVEPASGLSPRGLAHEAVDVVRAVLAERSEVRAQPPFVGVAVLEELQPKPATFYTTFNRLIALSPSRLRDLPAWWQQWSRADRVRITSRLTLDAPCEVSGGAWRATGRLRSPWLVRSIPVELLLWPYVGSWTRLSLEPQRAGH